VFEENNVKIETTTTDNLSVIVKIVKFENDTEILITTFDNDGNIVETTPLSDDGDKIEVLKLGSDPTVILKTTTYTNNSIVKIVDTDSEGNIVNTTFLSNGKKEETTDAADSSKILSIRVYDFADTLTLLQEFDEYNNILETTFHSNGTKTTTLKDASQGYKIIQKTEYNEDNSIKSTIVFNSDNTITETIPLYNDTVRVIEKLNNNSIITDTLTYLLTGDLEVSTPQPNGQTKIEYIAKGKVITEKLYDSNDKLINVKELSKEYLLETIYNNYGGYITERRDKVSNNLIDSSSYNADNRLIKKTEYITINKKEITIYNIIDNTRNKTIYINDIKTKQLYYNNQNIATLLINYFSDYTEEQVFNNDGSRIVFKKIGDHTTNKDVYDNNNVLYEAYEYYDTYTIEINKQPDNTYIARYVDNQNTVTQIKYLDANRQEIQSNIIDGTEVIKSKNVNGELISTTTITIKPEGGKTHVILYHVDNSTETKEFDVNDVVVSSVLRDNNDNLLKQTTYTITNSRIQTNEEVFENNLKIYTITTITTSGQIISSIKVSEPDNNGYITTTDLLTNTKVVKNGTIVISTTLYDTNNEIISITSYDADNNKVVTIPYFGYDIKTTINPSNDKKIKEIKVDNNNIELINTEYDSYEREISKIEKNVNNENIRTTITTYTNSQTTTEESIFSSNLKTHTITTITDNINDIIISQVKVSEPDIDNNVTTTNLLNNTEIVKNGNDIIKTTTFDNKGNIISIITFDSNYNIVESLPQKDNTTIVITKDSNSGKKLSELILSDTNIELVKNIYDTNEEITNSIEKNSIGDIVKIKTITTNSSGFREITIQTYFDGNVEKTTITVMDGDNLISTSEQSSKDIDGFYTITSIIKSTNIKTIETYLDLTLKSTKTIHPVNSEDISKEIIQIHGSELITEIYYKHSKTKEVLETHEIIGNITTIIYPNKRKTIIETIDENGTKKIINIDENGYIIDTIDISAVNLQGDYTETITYPDNTSIETIVHSDDTRSITKKNAFGEIISVETESYILNTDGSTERKVYDDQNIAIYTIFETAKDSKGNFTRTIKYIDESPQVVINVSGLVNNKFTETVHNQDGSKVITTKDSQKNILSTNVISAETNNGHTETITFSNGQIHEIVFDGSGGKILTIKDRYKDDDAIYIIKIIETSATNQYGSFTEKTTIYPEETSVEIQYKNDKSITTTNRDYNGDIIDITTVSAVSLDGTYTITKFDELNLLSTSTIYPTDENNEYIELIEYPDNTSKSITNKIDGSKSIVNKTSTYITSYEYISPINLNGNQTIILQDKDRNELSTTIIYSDKTRKITYADGSTQMFDENGHTLSNIQLSTIVDGNEVIIEKNSIGDVISTTTITAFDTYIEETKTITHNNNVIVTTKDIDTNLISTRYEMTSNGDIIYNSSFEIIQKPSIEINELLFKVRDKPFYISQNDLHIAPIDMIQIQLLDTNDQLITFTATVYNTTDDASLLSDNTITSIKWYPETYMISDILISLKPVVEHSFSTIKTIKTFFSKLAYSPSFDIFDQNNKKISHTTKILNYDNAADTIEQMITNNQFITGTTTLDTIVEIHNIQKETKTYADNSVNVIYSFNDDILTLSAFDAENNKTSETFYAKNGDIVSSVRFDSNGTSQTIQFTKTFSTKIKTSVFKDQNDLTTLTLIKYSDYNNKTLKYDHLTPNHDILNISLLNFEKTSFTNDSQAVDLNEVNVILMNNNTSLSLRGPSNTWSFVKFNTVIEMVVGNVYTFDMYMTENTLDKRYGGMIFGNKFPLTSKVHDNPSYAAINWTFEIDVNDASWLHYHNNMTGKIWKNSDGNLLTTEFVSNDISSINDSFVKYWKLTVIRHKNSKKDIRIEGYTDVNRTSLKYWTYVSYLGNYTDDDIKYLQYDIVHFGIIHGSGLGTNEYMVFENLNSTISKKIEILPVKGIFTVNIPNNDNTITEYLYDLYDNVLNSSIKVNTFKKLIGDTPTFSGEFPPTFLDITSLDGTTNNSIHPNNSYTQMILMETDKTTTFNKSLENSILNILTGIIQLPTWNNNTSVFNININTNTVILLGSDEDRSTNYGRPFLKHVFNLSDNSITVVEGYGWIAENASPWPDEKSLVWQKAFITPGTYFVTIDAINLLQSSSFNWMIMGVGYYEFNEETINYDDGSKEVIQTNIDDSSTKINYNSDNTIKSISTISAKTESGTITTYTTTTDTFSLEKIDNTQPDDAILLPKNDIELISANTIVTINLTLLDNISNNSIYPNKGTTEIVLMETDKSFNFNKSLEKSILDILVKVIQLPTWDTNVGGEFSIYVPSDTAIILGSNYARSTNFGRPFLKHVFNVSDNDLSVLEGYGSLGQNGIALNYSLIWQKVRVSPGTYVINSTAIQLLENNSYNWMIMGVGYLDNIVQKTKTEINQIEIDETTSTTTNKITVYDDDKTIISSNIVESTENSDGSFTEVSKSTPTLLKFQYSSNGPISSFDKYILNGTNIQYVLDNTIYVAEYAVTKVIENDSINATTHDLYFNAPNSDFIIEITFKTTSNASEEMHSIFSISSDSNTKGFQIYTENNQTYWQSTTWPWDTTTTSKFAINKTNNSFYPPLNKFGRYTFIFRKLTNKLEVLINGSKNINISNDTNYNWSSVSNNTIDIIDNVNFFGKEVIIKLGHGRDYAQSNTTTYRRIASCCVQTADIPSAPVNNIDPLSNLIIPEYITTTTTNTDGSSVQTIVDTDNNVLSSTTTSAPDQYGTIDQTIVKADNTTETKTINNDGTAISIVKDSNNNIISSSKLYTSDDKTTEIIVNSDNTTTEKITNADNSINQNIINQSGEVVQTINITAPDTNGFTTETIIDTEEKIETKILKDTNGQITQTTTTLPPDANGSIVENILDATTNTTTTKTTTTDGDITTVIKDENNNVLSNITISTNESTGVITTITSNVDNNTTTEKITNIDNSYTETLKDENNELIQTVHVSAPDINGNITETITAADDSYTTISKNSDGEPTQTISTSAPDIDGNITETLVNHLENTSTIVVKDSQASITQTTQISAPDIYGTIIESTDYTDNSSITIVKYADGTSETTNISAPDGNGTITETTIKINNSSSVKIVNTDGSVNETITNTDGTLIKTIDLSAPDNIGNITETITKHLEQTTTIIIRNNLGIPIESTSISAPDNNGNTTETTIFANQSSTIVIKNNNIPTQTTTISIPDNDGNTTETTIDHINSSTTIITKNKYDIKTHTTTIPAPDSIGNTTETTIDHINLTTTIITKNSENVLLQTIIISAAYSSNGNITETTIDHINLTTTIITKNSDDVVLQTTTISAPDIDNGNITETTVDHINVTTTIITKNNDNVLLQTTTISAPDITTGNTTETTVDHINLTTTIITKNSDAVLLQTTTISAPDDNGNITETTVDHINLTTTIITKNNVDTLLQTTTISAPDIDNGNITETTVDHINLTTTIITKNSDNVLLQTTTISAPDIDNGNIIETTVDHINLTTTIITKNSDNVLLQTTTISAPDITTGNTTETTVDHINVTTTIITKNNDNVLLQTTTISAPDITTGNTTETTVDNINLTTTIITKNNEDTLLQTTTISAPDIDNGNIIETTVDHINLTTTIITKNSDDVLLQTTTISAPDIDNGNINETIVDHINLTTTIIIKNSDDILLQTTTISAPDNGTIIENTTYNIDNSTAEKTSLSDGSSTEIFKDSSGQTTQTIIISTPDSTHGGYTEKIIAADNSYVINTYDVDDNLLQTDKYYSNDVLIPPWYSFNIFDGQSKTFSFKNLGYVYQGSYDNGTYYDNPNSYLKYMYEFQKSTSYRWCSKSDNLMMYTWTGIENGSTKEGVYVRIINPHTKEKSEIITIKQDSTFAYVVPTILVVNSNTFVVAYLKLTNTLDDFTFRGIYEKNIYYNIVSYNNFSITSNVQYTIPSQALDNLTAVDLIKLDDTRFVIAWHQYQQSLRNVMDCSGRGGCVVVNSYYETYNQSWFKVISTSNSVLKTGVAKSIVTTNNLLHYITFQLLQTSTNYFCFVFQYTAAIFMVVFDKSTYANVSGAGYSVSSQDLQSFSINFSNPNVIESITANNFVVVWFGNTGPFDNHNSSIIDSGLIERKIYIRELTYAGAFITNQITIDELTPILEYFFIGKPEIFINQEGGYDLFVWVVHRLDSDSNNAIPNYPVFRYAYKLDASLNKLNGPVIYDYNNTFNIIEYNRNPISIIPHQTSYETSYQEAFIHSDTLLTETPLTYVNNEPSELFEDVQIYAGKLLQ
jgi:hypothetical protein